MIRDDVVAFGSELSLEKIYKPEICWKLSRPVEEPHRIVRPHVENGTLDAREASARAIIVAVVQRDAQIWTRQQGQGVLIYFAFVAWKTDCPRLVVQVLIGVCYTAFSLMGSYRSTSLMEALTGICEGWNDQGNWWNLLRLGIWFDKERYPVRGSTIVDKDRVAA